MDGLTRRFVLGGLAVSAAMPQAAIANAPATVPRPPMRRIAAAAAGPASVTDLIAQAGLGGRVTFAVADAGSGQTLEARDPGLSMPPASVTKAITSLYALDALGPAYRFRTALIATGPVQNGVIAGDLVLAGGGDPSLATDGLGVLAGRLRAAGVRGIAGRFRIWSGAIPYLRAIDPDQPEHLGYNPAVSGLNLNFNRVYFEWKRGQGGYALTMDARGERFRPRAYTASMAIAARERPLFTYREEGGVERWTVAQAALGRNGGRWLPVRRPDLYAGDVFQTLARAEGVPLPAPEPLDGARPAGTVVASIDSDPLPVLLRDMMKYSTNMTAEAVGMTASARRGVTGGHAGSAAAMGAWLKGRTGAESARFADHSGLGPGTRISAGDMVAALVRLGPGAGLEALMKPVAMRDANGREVRDHPVRVMAKTGTLNFVSALSGWVTAPGGRRMAFAIFTGDVARRDAVPFAQRENPSGSAEWVRRSKRLQQQLIERWAAIYAR